MLTVAYVFAGLAAVIHVYIFWLEALAFETVGRKTFQVSAEDAAIMKPWAFNQGFYNLFLAIGTGTGITVAGSNRDVGVGLICFGVGSMLAAALVLISSDGSKARGAIVQGFFPLISLGCLALWSF